MRLQFTSTESALTETDEFLRMDPVIEMEPGDVLMASRTGERLGVKAVDGATVYVKRGVLDTRAVPLRDDDELFLLVDPYDWD